MVILLSFGRAMCSPLDLPSSSLSVLTSNSLLVVLEGQAGVSWCKNGGSDTLRAAGSRSGRLCRSFPPLSVVRQSCIMVAPHQSTDHRLIAATNGIGASVALSLSSPNAELLRSRTLLLSLDRHPRSRARVYREGKAKTNSVWVRLRFRPRYLICIRPLLDVPQGESPKLDAPWIPTVAVTTLLRLLGYCVMYRTTADHR